MFPGFEVLCPYGFTGQKHGIYGRMSIFKFPKINALSMILPNSVESAYEYEPRDIYSVFDFLYFLLYKRSRPKAP